MVAHLAVDAPPALAAGDVLDGRYRVIRQLARGGMATVFLAEHVRIKRRVAIKVLHRHYAADDAMVQRFMTEALAAGTLGHPNIVESLDMGFTNGVPFIVFEYLAGTVLTDVIYRAGGLPVRRALRIAQDVALALDAAHEAGIVHLDLKSDNVVLLAGDRVKVLDFGIARFVEHEIAREDRGLVIGTPDVMAPEQITSPDHLDRRADVYALGVLLYEMLAARRPFDNADPRVLLYRSVHEPPPPLERTDVPPELSRLLFGRLLAKSRERRFETMRELAATLAAIERDLGDDAATSTDALGAAEISALATGPHVPSLRLLWLVAAVVAGLAGGALLYAEHRIAASTDTSALAALDVDADKIATLLASEAHAAQRRADELAATPIVRAAVATDAATVADLIRDGGLPQPRPGETFELFEAGHSLGRLPRDAAPLAPDPHRVQLASDAAGVRVVATAVHGDVAIATPIDLSLIERLVAEDASTATLTGLGAPIELVHGRPGTTHLTIPVALAAEDVALAVTLDPTPRGATLHLAARVAWALGFALLVIYAGASAAARRPAI